MDDSSEPGKCYKQGIAVADELIAGGQESNELDFWPPVIYV